MARRNHQSERNNPDFHPFGGGGGANTQRTKNNNKHEIPETPTNRNNGVYGGGGGGGGTAVVSFPPDAFANNMINHNNININSTWDDPWKVDAWSNNTTPTKQVVWDMPKSNSPANLSQSKTVDTSFDSSLQYSESSFGDDNNNNNNTITDPFDANAFDDFQFFPTNPESNLCHSSQKKYCETIQVKIQERLSIFLEDTASTPTCRIIGFINVISNQAKLRSFCLTIRDRKSYIGRWEEQKEIVENITGTLTHLALDPSDQVFRIFLRDTKKLQAPIIAYSCIPTLKPVPVLMKTKVQRKGDRCRVGVRLRANPNNADTLYDVAIIMLVPPDVNGEMAALSKEGSIWDPMKRCLSWAIEELPPGEVIDIQAQFKCAVHNNDDTQNESSSLSKFPVLVRCLGNNTFSKVQLNSDYTDEGSTPVSLQVEKAFKIIYRKV